MKTAIERRGLFARIDGRWMLPIVHPSYREKCPQAAARYMVEIFKHRRGIADLAEIAAEDVQAETFDQLAQAADYNEPMPLRLVSLRTGIPHGTIDHIMRRGRIPSQKGRAKNARGRMVACYLVRIADVVKYYRARGGYKPKNGG